MQRPTLPTSLPRDYSNPILAELYSQADELSFGIHEEVDDKCLPPSCYTFIYYDDDLHGKLSLCSAVEETREDALREALNNSKRRIKGENK